MTCQERFHLMLVAQPAQPSKMGHRSKLVGLSYRCGQGECLGGVDIHVEKQRRVVSDLCAVGPRLPVIVATAETGACRQTSTQPQDAEDATQTKIRCDFMKSSCVSYQYASGSSKRRSERRQGAGCCRCRRTEPRGGRGRGPAARPSYPSRHLNGRALLVSFQSAEKKKSANRTTRSAWQL